MQSIQGSETGPAPCVAIFGAGPAGLMAAEVLAQAGARVTVHDHMARVGRKFLLAGRGGLNLTHAEPLDRLLGRYRPAAPALIEAVRAFPPAAVIAWCEGLGIATFVGSSQRLFPVGLKASPLLRAWLARLSSLGVTFRSRNAWPPGPEETPPAATVLAMGGASWARLGSDGRWPKSLPGLRTRPWAPSNMALRVDWSEHFAQRFEGTPLKRVTLRFGDHAARGEAVITRSGIEGGAVYALSAPVRDALAKGDAATLWIDLRPDLPAAEIAMRLGSRSRAESLANMLRKALALPPVAIGLVQEVLRAGAGADVANLVKALPLPMAGVASIERAISSAGGLDWAEVDARLMLRSRPGVFACGEMLDWEAPTGGYLLQGCFSTGVAAAHGVLGWLEEQALIPAPPPAASAP